MIDTVNILFSVNNEYDQPDRAFICWWKTKPSIEAVAKALGIDFSQSDDDGKANVVSVWLGETRRINDTDYWIEVVVANPTV